MSSAGVIAHCLSPSVAPSGWLHDIDVGGSSAVAGTNSALVWHPTHERFLMLLSQSPNSTLWSSPDGRPPWRLDYTFNDRVYHLAIGDDGRIVTLSADGTYVGDRVWYSDNLRDWSSTTSVAPSLTVSRDTALIFNGFRFMAFGDSSTVMYSTDYTAASWVSSSGPPSTSGNIGGVLVWPLGTAFDDRVIIAINGSSAGALDSKIMYTDDGGVSWSLSAFNNADPNPQVAYDGIVTDGTTIRAYKLIDGALYRSDSVDGGLTFTNFAVSSGSAVSTPVEMLNYYDGIWWGRGRHSGTPVTVSPEVLSSATGLRTFTRDPMTNWPGTGSSEIHQIAHNEYISLCLGEYSGLGTNIGWIGYKYRT